MSAVTAIVISGITIPNAAIRAPSVGVRLIENGDLLRDWNGELHDLTFVTHQKREITVSLDSQVRAPAMLGIWRGAQVFITLPKHVLGDDLVGPIECKISDYEVERDEFGARTGWSLTLWEK